MSDLALAEANARLALAQGPDTCASITAAEIVALFERLRAAEAERDAWRRRAEGAADASAAVLREGLEVLQAHADAQAMLGEVATDRDEENELWTAVLEGRRSRVALLDSLAAQIANYAANHGARCDAEQERLATIAESACRMLDAVRRRLNEVPGLRAKVAARDAALDACASRISGLLADVASLTSRRDELLALVASISQSTPLPSDLEGWEGQRAALLAEIGTLRAKVAELERERDEWKRLAEDNYETASATIDSLAIAYLSLARLWAVTRDGRGDVDINGRRTR